MRIRKDVSGGRFGRLTAVIPHSKRNGVTMWRCQCDCGRERVVRVSLLLNGHTKSCGCLRIDASRRRQTHGMSNHRAYINYKQMVKRCRNQNDVGYPNYGGRGIKVCDRWLESFENFWDDMGPGYDPMLTLDRIDNNGDYDPKNCRWATKTQQHRNQRSNVIVCLNGERMTLAEAAERLGVEYHKFYHDFQRSMKCKKE